MPATDDQSDKKARKTRWWIEPTRWDDDANILVNIWEQIFIWSVVGMLAAAFGPGALVVRHVLRVKKSDEGMGVVWATLLFSFAFWAFVVWAVKRIPW